MLLLRFVMILDSLGVLGLSSWFIRWCIRKLGLWNFKTDEQYDMIDKIVFRLEVFY